ncbi:unnamed protein product [Cylindrotheca closterium]|uniref:Uncharacterized protein n=1 Tax=Cylindrotheca closterium TaxID=2856 RepID=A0AAD2CH98_9STRA|nr:unnamed protein product [Cylindrotheca closterium]
MTAAQQQVLPISSSRSSTRLPLNMVQQESRLNRERFVVFLQILLRRLEVSQAFHLKLQAKVLVMQCTRNNKMGDATPLVTSLELHLRQLVGEVHWRYAIHATHRYFRQKQQQQQLQQQRFPFHLKTTQVIGL